MKRSAIISGILHITIIILIMLDLRNPFRRAMAEQKPMMIEFVNIADFSQAPVIAPQDVQDPEPLMNEPEQTPEPLPEPMPQPEPEPTQPQHIPLPEPVPEPPKPEPVPEPPKPEPQPEPEAEPLPALEPIKPEKPRQEPKPEPKPIKKPEPEIEKPKEEPKPKKEKVEINLDPKKSTPKPKKDVKTDKKKVDQAFDNLLDDIVKEDKKGKKSSKSSGRTKGAPADRVGDVVTASEIDAIRQIISKYWIIPNGARGAKDLVVKIDLKIAKDGTILDAKITETGRMRDPVYRAAAESAQRAAMDPRSSPLPLNPDKYEEWKEIRLSFDPKDMY